jgi:formylglycine-generating enzyme required for sulfatase activity
MDKKLNDFLREEQLEHLLPLFVEQRVGDDLLGTLSDNDLRNLGIDKLGDRKRLLTAFQAAAGSPPAQTEEPPAHDPIQEQVTVKGGELPPESSLAGTEVGPFDMGKYTVTKEEWQRVRGWGIANGFEIEQGAAEGFKHPITDISWYDVVKWCNAKSLLENRTPAYKVGGVVYKSGEFGPNGSRIVLWNPKADGYRLPTKAEWEWAARGGQKTQGYTFSGSNDLNAVGWFNENAGGSAHEVGEKLPNELGLHDMSGNVWEWCWDLVPKSSYRPICGGSWVALVDYCAVTYSGSVRPGYRYEDFGFRLVRNFFE